jgi:hypothetical protein
MGFAPSEVDSMMLWAFAACADGYARANGAEEVPEAPSFEEHQEMLRRLAG